MRRKDVKAVLSYYYSMAAAQADFERERRELETEYSALRGTAWDAFPRASMPGKPTEALALRAEERHVRDRLRELDVREQVLCMDCDVIRGCLDALRGEYKRLLCSRYRDRHSWARLAARDGVPDRTVRRRHDRALDRLGELLDDVPMAEELVRRAEHARP